MSVASNSKSSHEPRYGITRAANRNLPDEWVLPRSWSKSTPGERCICDTITRSVPLTKKVPRSEEHTSELQSLMRISYAVFCLKKKTQKKQKDSQLSETRKHHIQYQ